MSEPYVPVPEPEPNSHWDPHPARCSIEGCRNILIMKGDGIGFCSAHGDVTAKYFETQNFELEDDVS